MSETATKIWNDPVWSKVIAAIIIWMLSGLSTLAYSLYSKIPFGSLLHAFSNADIRVKIFAALASLFIVANIAVVVIMFKAVNEAINRHFKLSLRRI